MKTGLLPFPAPPNLNFERDVHILIEAWRNQIYPYAPHDVPNLDSIAILN